MYRFLVAVLLVSFFTSCEREIEIELPNAENLLVVEGSIETGQAPVVLVTRNRGFFKDFPTDLESFINEFVIQDALVVVSDGAVNDTLIFTVNILAYPYVYYTSTNMVGEVGKTYSLTIVADGKTIRSHTTIPPAVSIDSTWFGSNPFDSSEDSLGVAYLSITDPDSMGNAYRLFAKIKDISEFNQVAGSEFNDDYVNGQKVIFFAGQGEKPFVSSDTFVPKEYFYNIGDTIILKFCSIGAKELKFFYTMDAALNSNGNPFAAPTLVKSNIEGGLGVWCGYSPSYDTLIATK
jgi:hypothetical protein